jgi:hypothetical protein
VRWWLTNGIEWCRARCTQVISSDSDANIELLLSATTQKEANPIFHVVSYDENLCNVVANASAFYLKNETDYAEGYH